MTHNSSVKPGAGVPRTYISVTHGGPPVIPASGGGNRTREAMCVSAGFD